MAIYPKEILNFTYEAVHKKYRTNSSIIYKISIALIFLFIILIPIIKLDVNITSRGIINSYNDNYILRSAINGKINKVNFKENSRISKGDTLILIDNSELISKQKFLLNNLEIKLQQLKDIEKILLEDFTFLESKKYIEEVDNYLSNIKIHQLNIANEKRKFKRQKYLYKSNVISSSEFERSKYELDIKNANLENYKSDVLKRWSVDFDIYTKDINLSKSQLIRVSKDIESTFLISPIDGYITNYNSLEKNSLLFLNQHIAEISPSKELVADIFITPNDIGFIKENMNVKFQIDAYNYNQWGFIEGKITELNKDISIVENIPVFKVRCILNKNKLSLKNGFEGKLIKGMGVNARIKISERSIYNLIYDKIDDWVNPNIKEV